MNLWWNKFVLTCGLKSNVDMILAGELQFYQMQEKLTVKNKLRLGRDSNPCHPDTDWAMLQSHTLWVRKTLEKFIFFLEKNLCIFKWDKSNRAMTNAGEVKFWQLQNSPEKRRKRARSLTSVRVTSLPTWEESKNLETILLLLLFFLFLFFNTLGVLKSVRVYLFATFLFG